MIFLCSLDITAGYEIQLSAYSMLAHFIIKDTDKFSTPGIFHLWWQRSSVYDFFSWFSEEMSALLENKLFILYLNYFIQKMGNFLP